MRLKVFLLSASAILFAVLMPLSAQAADASSTAAAPATVLDALNAQPDLAAFAKIATEAGVGDVLKGPTVTLFVPLDTAFAQVPQDKKSAILASVETEKAFVLAHTVVLALTADALKTATTLTSANGQSIAVSLDAGSNTVLLNGSVKIVRVIVAKNGIVFVVDGVLAGK